MSRPTSRNTDRPTLKLPAKAATEDAASAIDLRAKSRKPIRGGAKQAKPSVAQRALDLAAREARIAALKQAAADRPRPRRDRDVPRDKPPAPHPASAQPGEAERSTTRREFSERKPYADRTPVRESRPATPSQADPLAAPPAKVYPKRGIARSTGARALPPVRPRSDDELLPRPNTNRRDNSPPSAPPRSPAPMHSAARPPRPSPAPAPATAHSTTAKVEHVERRPLHEPPRLAKRVSEIAQCSRREADEWIENGWVSVDGVVVTTLGTRAHPNAKIVIRDDASQHKTECVTLLFNKPLDEVSRLIEDSTKHALSQLRPENRWTEDDTPYSFKATHLRGLAQAGKLDQESTGMLVFTQEGSVARRITGDDTRLEKEYMVRVEGELSPEGLKQLNFGLTLDDIKLKRAQVSWQNEQQLRFVLHESRLRQIQCMCALVGLKVISIKRIRIGSVSLGKLPPGKWRYLRENERF